ncbi:MAG TPA: hypothetical protein VMU16_12955 [Candidatus Binataceae bacterium]|nr:hypothetical protein [Candidatus Binataceae bacterium]
MNLRHTASIALVGWYLMLPPLIQNSNNSVSDFTLTDPKAPLSNWVKQGTFDSARECEEALQKLVTAAEANQDSEVVVMTISDLEKIRQARSAKCVDMDDPRLKGN